MFLANDANLLLGYFDEFSVFKTPLYLKISNRHRNSRILFMECLDISFKFISGNFNKYFLFIRWHQLWFFCNFICNLFQSGDRWNPYLEPRLAHILSIVFLTFSLHLIDRQVSKSHLTNIISLNNIFVYIYICVCVYILIK